MSLLPVPGGAGQALSLTFFSTESPPIWSAKLELDGLGGEILHAIAREAKADVRLDYLPLKRYERVVSGNRVGNPDFFTGHEFGAVVPILATRAVFCYYRPHRTDDLRFNSIEDLRGMTLGVERGTLEDKEAFNALGIHVEENATPEGLFRKLHAGRVDLILMLDIMAHYHVEKLFPGERDQFRLVEIAGGLTPIAMMLERETPQSEDIAREMFKALEHLIANGTYESILRKYYGAAGIPALWRSDLRRLMDHYRGRRVVGYAD